MLHQSLLTEAEYSLLEEICKIFLEEENVAIRINMWSEFNAFFESHKRTKLQSHEKLRLLRNVRKYKYSRVVEFYDFLVNDFRRSLADKTGEVNQSLLTRVIALREAGLRRPLPHNPFLPFLSSSSMLTLDGPEDWFAGDYLGYRVSSRHGEVLRFALSIYKEPGAGVVQFKNYYERDERNVCNEGIGFQLGRYLYLVGEAVDANDASHSLGFRMIALRRWRPSSNLMNGLVISQDRTGIIAAKVVLAPIKAHSFDENSIYSSIAFEEEDGRLDWEDCKKIVIRDRNIYLQDSYEKLQKQYLDQFYGAIESGSNDDYKLGLWHFISNLTNTVLLGRVDGANNIKNKINSDEYDGTFDRNMYAFLQILEVNIKESSLKSLTESILTRYLDTQAKS